VAGLAKRRTGGKGSAKTKITIEVPKRLFKQFKKHCVDKDTTMNEHGREIIERHLRSGKDWR